MGSSDPRGAEPQQIVFIDANVPDRRELLRGLAPGVEAFVLDPHRDGLRQIAAILARHHLTDLSSISIVGHGSSGVIDVGGTALDGADLSTYTAELAKIGAALAPSGDLQLYACDVGQGAAGDAFLQQLSQATGGANIAAASHLVGSAAEGGSWDLNVDVGTADVASPFTAAAVSAYPDVMSLTNNQIVFTTWNGTTGPEGAGNRVEQFGVSGSSEIAGSTIDLADGTQSKDSGVNYLTSGVAVDTALNEYFVAADNPVTYTLSIQEGSLTGSGGLSTFFTVPLQDATDPNITSSTTFAILGGLALDAQTNELYFAQAAENAETGDTVAADTGIYKVSLSGGTPILLTPISAGLVNPDYVALDTSANLLFFDDSIEAGDGFPATDNLDVVNLTTGAVTVLKSFFNSSDSVDLLQGLAVSGNTLYLTTVDYSDATSANNQILKIPFTVTGSGSTANAALGAVTTLYSGSGADQPSDIVIDAANGIFYTTGETPATVDSSPGDVATVFEGSLSGGTSLTPVLSMTGVTGPLTSTSSPAFDTNDPQLVLLTQPTITASGTVTFVTGGGAVLVDSGLTVSDEDGQNLAGATITGALTGDTLSFNGGATKTFSDGGTISSSFSGGTLTLSGDASPADYQSALDAVTFATTSTNASPRTIGWTVTDGVVSSATADSTVDVHVPPVVTAGAMATFDGGGAAVALDSGLTIADASSSTLSSATVTITGYISGDILTVGTAGGLGQNFSNGTLTLNGTASLATYETALDSITYSFTPTNGDPTGGGSHTTRTIDWSVNDGTLSSNTATSTLDTVHVAPTVTAGANVNFGFGGSPAILDAGLTVTDGDSGGDLSSATVSIGTGYVSGDDTLSFTTQNGIVGLFSSGELTLSGVASILDYETALESITFDTTSTTTGSRTIDWAVNDGVLSSAVATSTVDVAPCYCPGTLIQTPRGQKKVEKLKIGDKVMTASGEARRIKWIGRRSYSGRFVMGRKDVLPVCVKAGALEDNVPKRDLWISPNHAMYLDGVLIEAKDLVNGVSIVQAESAESIEYYHVELDTHDVLIAEGALAESYIDDDNRLLFHNAHEFREKYPDQVIGPAQYYAPRCDSGYELETVRQRIALRAGLVASEEAPPIGNLRGFVDRITGECVSGWAQNLDHPEAPVCLDVVAGGLLLGQVLASGYRQDLKQAGMGSGCHSFEFALPPEIVVAADEIEVRRSLDGTALELTIEAWRMLRQSTSRGREGRRAVA